MRKFHIVVHHKQDSHQPWPNAWVDDNRLQGITTTRQIGRLCAEAEKNGDPVFVHRCGYSDCVPCICCSVKVDAATDIGGGQFYVGFKDPVVLGHAPMVSPYLGQNFYLA